MIFPDNNYDNSIFFSFGKDIHQRLFINRHYHEHVYAIVDKSIDLSDLNICIVISIENVYGKTIILKC